MSYEELKRELFCNVLNWGVIEEHILFLEKRPLFTNSEIINAVKPYDSKYGSFNATDLYGSLSCSARGERRAGGRGYAKNREQLIIRLQNYACNREELEDGIYWRFGDIALVLYGVLRETDTDYAAIKVSRSMTEGWNVSKEVILTDALLNSYAKMPPRLYHNTDLPGCHSHFEGVFMPGEVGIPIVIDREKEKEGMTGYRLTTTKGYYGAIAAFYPGVKEHLSQLLGGDFFLGFASVHKVVVHPVQHKILNNMKSAILQSNAVADEKEVLTNQVYRYCVQRGELVEV